MGEGALGGAVAGAGVDDGGSADGAAGEDGDIDVAEGDGHALVAIEVAIGEGGATAEARAAVVMAFFEQEHGAAAGGELVGRGGAACAGADDDDLAFEVGVFVDFAAVLDLLEPSGFFVADGVDFVAAADVGEHLGAIEMLQSDGGEKGADELAEGVEARVAKGLQGVEARLEGQGREGAAFFGQGGELDGPEGGLEEVRGFAGDVGEPPSDAEGGGAAGAVEAGALGEGGFGDGGEDVELARRDRLGPGGRFRGRLRREARGFRGASGSGGGGQDVEASHHGVSVVAY